MSRHLLFAVLAFLLSGAAAAQTDPGIPTYSLAELERRAAEHNPALAQAEAVLQAADARRVEAASLMPNPVVGYTAEDVPLDDGDEGDGRHGVFVSQEVPLGGKLRLSRGLLAQDLAATRVGAEGERQRLLAGLRLLYYRTLAAQARVEVRERLAALTREAVEVTDQLFNTGSADATDRLAIQNEAALVETDLSAARVELDQLWSALRSAVADPALEPGRLEGDLAAGLPDLDREEWRTKLLAGSPDLALARLSLARAEAALARERAERTPDLELEAGVREQRGGVRAGDREAFADVGVRIPLWNRNQGGIAAAEAEVARAKLEAERLRLALESRYAGTFARYRQAAERARTYREGVLDRARSAYEQYLASYQQMAAAYPQVLIAQRTLIQLEEDYLLTLERAWGAATALQSLLAAEPSASTLNQSSNNPSGH